MIKSIKIKERGQHLPDSCIQTSLEQTGQDERGQKQSF